MTTRNATVEEMYVRRATSIGFQIMAAEDSLAEFAEKFQKDPAYALSWSQETFRNAAKLKINRIVGGLFLYHFDEETPFLEAVTSMVKHVTEKVMQGAQFPSHSSSAQSNEMEAEETAAWASKLEGLLELQTAMLDSMIDNS